MSEIPVLNHGFVRLDGALADDLSVVNSARVSFARHQDEMDDAAEGLLRFLMTNRHGTPFEHNMFRFHVKAPIFVFREWQRHRISSYNEWSARYSKIEPEFYVPTPETLRGQVGRPGNYTFEPVKDPFLVADFIRNLRNHQEEGYRWYEEAIESGVAREQARLFLPVSIYSQMYWTVNARSLMNFLSLRNSEQAQWEIRQYAKVIETIFADLMPVTADAFVRNNRIAP